MLGTILQTTVVNALTFRLPNSPDFIAIGQTEPHLFEERSQESDVRHVTDRRAARRRDTPVLANHAFRFAALFSVVIVFDAMETRLVGLKRHPQPLPDGWRHLCLCNLRIRSLWSYQLSHRFLLSVSAIVSFVSCWTARITKSLHDSICILRDVGTMIALHQGQGQESSMGASMPASEQIADGKNWTKILAQSRLFMRINYCLIDEILK